MCVILWIKPLYYFINPIDTIGVWTACDCEFWALVLWFICKNTWINRSFVKAIINTISRILIDKRFPFLITINRIFPTEYTNKPNMTQKNNSIVVQSMLCITSNEYMNLLNLSTEPNASWLRFDKNSSTAPVELEEVMPSIIYGLAQNFLYFV